MKRHENAIKAPFKAMDLMLGPGILEAVTDHARRCYPNEGCGLLVGRGTAERFIAIANVSTSPTEYMMDPAELINELRKLRGTGDQLIAIYHSHPHTAPEPSKTDVERAYYPEVTHLIVSLADLERPRAAAFRIIEGDVLAIELHVIV